jgi:hypothetical protein
MSSYFNDIVEYTSKNLNTSYNTSILIVFLGFFATIFVVSRLREARRLSPAERAQRAILITGCDTGFGRILAEESGKQKRRKGGKR